MHQKMLFLVTSYSKFLVQTFFSLSNGFFCVDLLVLNFFEDLSWHKKKFLPKMSSICHGIRRFPRDRSFKWIKLEKCSLKSPFTVWCTHFRWGGRTFIRQLFILSVSPPSTSQRRVLCAQTTYGLKPFQRRLLSVENNLLHQKPHLRRLCGTQSTVLKRKFEVRRFEADWSPQKPVRVSSTLFGTKTEKNCGGSDFKGFAGCNTRPKCFSWRNLIWKRLSDKCPAPPKILTKNQPGVYTVRWTDS